MGIDLDLRMWGGGGFFARGQFRIFHRRTLRRRVRDDDRRMSRVVGGAVSSPAQSVVQVLVDGWMGVVGLVVAQGVFL